MPARCWRLRRRQLTFGKLPSLMGIVNVTPDSFSDGGRYFDHQLAIDQALRLHQAGAEILDIGGESTRPYADPVGLNEELRRVLPVIEAVVGLTDAIVSVDTSKAAVAEQALLAGAEIVNDVTGLEGDPEMIDVVHATSAWRLPDAHARDATDHARTTQTTTMCCGRSRITCDGARRIWFKRVLIPRGSASTLASVSANEPVTTWSCYSTLRSFIPWGFPCSWGTRVRDFWARSSAIRMRIGWPPPLEFPWRWR